MILVDTGLLVALFNPKDSYHAHSHNVLQMLRELLLTTIPVLTEAFNLLGPGSKRALGLGAFVQKKGITVWSLEDENLNTAMLLMEKYEDKPMDLADASLITAPQVLAIQRIFTMTEMIFGLIGLHQGIRLEVLSCYETKA